MARAMASISAWTDEDTVMRKPKKSAKLCRKCEHCGGGILDGRRKMFCSTACEQAYSPTRSWVRRCGICNETFIATYTRTLYCNGADCREIVAARARDAQIAYMREKRRQSYELTKWRVCKACGDTFERKQGGNRLYCGDKCRLASRCEASLKAYYKNKQDPVNRAKRAAAYRRYSAKLTKKLEALPPEVFAEIKAAKSIRQAEWRRRRKESDPEQYFKQQALVYRRSLEKIKDDPIRLERHLAARSKTQAKYRAKRKLLQSKPM